MADDAYVQAEGLTKIFGDAPERGLDHLQAGMSKAELLDAHDLSVGVYDATFSIQQGEIFVIMGLSGSGKSTLLRLVNRLIEPTGGVLRLQGRDVMGMSPEELVTLRRDTMAMVFQSFALMPHLDVIHNVMFGLRVMGVPRKQRRERALAALEQVGLEAYAGYPPEELSGGMQQRVGLARALCVEPELLLMDEAFSALDPLIREEMQGQLLELQAARPRTVLFVSHDLDEAMRLGDRIAIMEAGEIVQIGTPREIVQRPANDFVRSFVAGTDTSRVLRARDVAEPADEAMDGAPIDGDATLEALARRLVESEGPVPVSGPDGGIVGQVTKDVFIRHVGGLT